MTSTLLPGRLAAAIKDVARDGHAHVPGAISCDARRQLVDELSLLRATRARERVGQVTQRADMAIIDQSELRSRRRLSEFTHEFNLLIQSSGLSAPWEANQLTLMRYRDLSDGITPHRDHQRYRYLIAAISLTGLAELSILPRRTTTTASACYTCAPGDLVLLRGSGETFKQGKDPRPLHALRHLTGEERLSLTLRMDASTGTSLRLGPTNQ